MQQTPKTKICLIGDMLSDGGAERVMADLSNYFAGTGINVHIIIIQDKVTYPYSGTLLNLGLYKGLGILNKLKRFLRLRSYLIKENFDFIIDTRYKNNYIQEWITSELLYRKKKIVFTIHSSILKYYIPNSDFLGKLVFRKAYGFVTVSDKIKEAIDKKPYAYNIRRIYNPINATHIRLLAMDGPVPDYNYILAAGSMNGDTKQFDRLIAAYAETPLPGQDIKLVILGKGKLKDDYVRQAKDLGLADKVIFPGFKENPFVFMKNALFFVLSSKREGLGMVLIESLACGTPVVSFDCDAGPSEIITDRYNGLLIKDQDFSELAKGMSQMAENAQLYKQCKANSEASIRKFEMETVGRQWLEYLKIN